MINTVEDAENSGLFPDVIIIEKRAN